jgi:energy-coupling factor transporter transmembrane protein EcfT
MHAGLTLFLWAVAVAWIQTAEGVALALLVVASLVAARIFADGHVSRLIGRIRLLLFVIVALFAWLTPGEVVFYDWPRLSPSREGLLLAFEHGGRLVAVVCWVALLVGCLPPDRLVSGFYACCRPACVLGIPAEKVALRLLLVLRLVDAGRTSGPLVHDWRQWLAAPAENDAENVVRLVRERFGVVDGMVVAMLLALFCGWWLW